MRKAILGLMLSLALTHAAPTLGAVVRADEPRPKRIVPCELNPEDYAVYSAILDDLGRPEDPEEEWRGRAEMVLADRTVYYSGAGGAWGFRSNSKQAPLPQTVTNFEARVKSVCTVQPLFTSKLSPRIVSSVEISDFFKKKGDGWEGFYRKYPKSSGYWAFSPVGYSNDSLEALVYVDHSCGYLCGTGHLVLLEKENGAWIVKNRVMLWIS